MRHNGETDDSTMRVGSAPPVLCTNEDTATCALLFTVRFTGMEEAAESDVWADVTSGAMEPVDSLSAIVGFLLRLRGLGAGE